MTWGRIMGKNAAVREDFDTLAERYADKIDKKPHNAYYERPATLALLPDVNRKKVLDAGCGPGKYAEILVERGAEVVAFDLSPRMIEQAKERLGGKATFVVADMVEPLDFLDDASFDGVVAPLSLDYIENWQPTFHEFYRVLKPGGFFILSICNPVMDAAEERCTNYFNVEPVVETWIGFGGEPAPVHKFRRSFEAILSPLLEAGFKLDRLVEPIPTQEFAEALPDDYALLTRRPGFLCMRTVKPDLHREFDSQ
jgi:ubiquinone/menaquinone biosynthesis C-methylase UbiE